MTLGFRVKSGYAIAVILDGTADRPAAVARRIVELSDPKVKETRQPYHSDFGEAEDDQRKIARRVAIIERVSRQSVADLLRGATGADAAPRAKRQAGARIRAGLVVGSVIDPAKVGNQHIRAHANEGRLFRTVLADALRQHGVECDVIVEKELAAAAAKRLAGRDLSRTLTGFGKTLGSPWRSDEKAAATAAWMALAM